jgi:hypothetical protein
MGTKIGHLFLNASSNSSVTTLVTPATNTAGIEIATMSVFAQGSAVIYADTSAPSSSTDATKRAIYSVSVSTQTLPFALSVPPGIGLYLASNQPGSVSLTYDVLT